MKNLKFIILILAIAFANSLVAQNLRTVESYYDPYSMTKIKERYTVETQRMQLHGLYQMWDSYGSIMEETKYSNGKKNGSSKQYFTAAFILTFEGDKKNIGKVAKDENYLNDELHGECKYYHVLGNDDYVLEGVRNYKNGELEEETIYYDNGKKKHVLRNNGLCERWYENGQKESEFYLKDGLENGELTSWDKNGRLFQKGTYKEGLPVGKMVYYYPNGDIVMDIMFGDNMSVVMEMKEYATNKNLKSEISKTGEKTIKGITYDTLTNEIVLTENLIYEDFGSGTRVNYGDGVEIMRGIQAIHHGSFELKSKGKVIAKGSYDMGLKIGKWLIHYNESWSEVTDLDSASFYREITYGEKLKPIGKVTDYYVDGQKQWEGFLLSVNPDVYDGECFYYYPNGQIQSHQFYSSGNKTGQWNSYYQNSQLVEQVVFVQDKPDGDYQQFWENGKLKQEGTYKFGKLVGEWKDYNEDGSLMGITYYDNQGIKIGSKATWQLEQENEDKIRQNINAQRIQLRQRFVLNSPTAQEKQIGDSYEIVFNSIITKVNNTESYDDKKRQLERLQLLGNKILSLDDNSIKPFSKQLKNQNSPETILNVFGIN